MWTRVVTGVLLATCAAVAAGGQTVAPRTPSLIADSLSGRDSFEFYCSSCHGLTGKGDGPVAPALKMPPADLTALTRQNRGTFPRDRLIFFVTGTGRELPAHGSSDMPVWGPIFRSLDPSDVRVKLRIDNVVTYIETLQVK
jgi:mono/diheme cytochrome c family protein